MTIPDFKDRLKTQLERKGVQLTEEQLEQAVKKYYSVEPPSVAAVLLMPAATDRADAYDKAIVHFKPILSACCDAFDLSPSKAKTAYSFNDNWRDLRSIAAYIGLKRLKIRPASAMAEVLGLPTPAAVYHQSYRAEKLIKEKRVVFCEKLELITASLDV